MRKLGTSLGPTEKVKLHHLVSAVLGLPLPGSYSLQVEEFRAKSIFYYAYFVGEIVEVEIFW